MWYVGARRVLLGIFGPTTFEPANAAGTDPVEQSDELTLCGDGQHAKDQLMGLANRLVELSQKLQALPA